MPVKNTLNKCGSNLKRAQAFSEFLGSSIGFIFLLSQTDDIYYWFQNHPQRYLNRNFSWWSDTAEIYWKMLTRTGSELAPSRYRPSAIPVELLSPRGLAHPKVRVQIPFESTFFSWFRQCQTYHETFLFMNLWWRFWNRIETLHILIWISIKLSRDVSSA